MADLASNHRIVDVGHPQVTDVSHANVHVVPSTPFRWRRLLQFRLRSLLLLVIAAAIPACYLERRIAHYHRQAHALLVLRQQGSRISSRPTQPEWFWNFFFPNASSIFQDVTELTACGANFDSDNLAIVCEMKALQSLCVKDSMVDDPWVASLASLSNLYDLNLSGTRIGNSALAQISRFPSLNQVDLSNTDIDNAGMVHLRGHHNLHRLCLHGTKITYRCMPNIGRLPTLDTLTLPGPAVSREGFLHLAALRHLGSIALVGASVDDDTLKQLADCPDLPQCAVFIDHSHVTEPGLRNFASAKLRIRYVFVRDCEYLSNAEPLVFNGPNFTMLVFAQP